MSQNNIVPASHILKVVRLAIVGMYLHLYNQWTVRIFCSSNDAAIKKKTFSFFTFVVGL